MTRRGGRGRPVTHSNEQCPPAPFRAYLGQPGLIHHCSLVLLLFAPAH